MRNQITVEVTTYFLSSVSVKTCNKPFFFVSQENESSRHKK